MVKEQIVKFVVYLTIVLNYSFVIYSLYQGGGTVTIGIVIVGIFTTLLLVGVFIAVLNICVQGGVIASGILVALAVLLLFGLENPTCLKWYLSLNTIYLLIINIAYLYFLPTIFKNGAIWLGTIMILVLLIICYLHVCVCFYYHDLKPKSQSQDVEECQKQKQSDVKVPNDANPTQENVSKQEFQKTLSETRSEI